MSCFSRVASIVAVSTALATMSADDAWAYSCITTSCSAHCESPVTFKLGTPSGDLGLATTEVELKKGMEAWTAPACSSLKLQYKGTTTEAPANANGVVAWVESGWQSGSGTIGVTTSRLSSRCLSSQIVMNGVNFRWVTGKPAARSEVNAFTIIAHEGGHYLGLSHSNAGGAVMAAQYAGGVTPLNADDEAGICKIYPGGGGMSLPGPPPSPGAGGAGGTGGAGGAGGAASPGKPGSGALCAACQVGTECASGTCVRNNNSGERFCGQSCDGGCPGGFQCATVDATTGIRQCVPAGGSCMTAAPPAPAPAAPGSEESPGGGGSGGRGGNVASGMGGATSSGGSTQPPASMSAVGCARDSDCAGDERCNESKACELKDEGRIVVADGESCQINDDCQSQLCVEREDGGFCSRMCTQNSDCVSGFACNGKGQEKVCTPLDSGTQASDEPVRSVVGCSMAAGPAAGHGLVLLTMFAFTFGLALRVRRRLGSPSKGLGLVLVMVCLNNTGCGAAADSDDVIDDQKRAGEDNSGGPVGSATPTPSPSGGFGGSATPTPSPSGGFGGSLNPAPSPAGGAGGSGGTRPAPPSDGTGAAPAMPAGCSVTLPGGGGKDPGGVIPVCCAPAPSDKALIEEVFKLLNAHRVANGRAPLEYDTKLEESIQGHCQHMALHSFFSHTAPEASVANFSARAKACSVSATGENIASQQRNANEVMTSWKNSAGHNMNMLNTAYKRVGIGHYQRVWGQIFGR